MFSSMKVGTRLAIAFGIVVVLLGTIIAVGVNRMAAVNEGLRVVTEENNVEIAHATSLRGAIFASWDERDVAELVRLVRKYADVVSGAAHTDPAKTS